MRRRFRAELHRLALSRAARSTMVVVGLTVVWLSASAAVGSTQDIAAARQRAERLAQEARTSLESSLPLACPEGMPPPPRCLQTRWMLETTSADVYFEDPRFSVARSTRQRMSDHAAIVAVALAVLGGIVAGTDWTNGVVVSALLGSPRRGRLFAGKLVPFAFAAGAIVFGACVLLVVGDTLASMWRGSLEGMSLSFVVGQLAPVGVRAMAAGAVVGAIGYAIGFAFRSAVAALVTAIAYIGAAEIGIRHLVEGSASWLAFTNVTAFIRGGLLYFSSSSDGSAYTPHVLSVTHAAAVLGTALFAVVIIASMSVRRDA